MEVRPHPHPPLDHWSPMHKLAVKVCHLGQKMPDGPWWYQFADLARAYNACVRIHGLGFKEQKPHTFALLVNDYPHRAKGLIDRPTVPWYRMRDENGLARHPYRVDARDWDPNSVQNRCWTFEDGHLSGASAVPAQKLDIILALQRGELDYPTP